MVVVNIFEIFLPGLSLGTGSVDRRPGSVLDRQEPNSRDSGSTLHPMDRSNNCTCSNLSSPPFRAPCMADFLMESRRNHCMEAPCLLHRENMVMDMGLDMAMPIVTHQEKVNL